MFAVCNSFQRKFSLIQLQKNIFVGEGAVGACHLAHNSSTSAKQAAHMPYSQVCSAVVNLLFSVVSIFMP